MTFDVDTWINQQPSSVQMSDLWSAILREAWQSGLTLAEEHTTSITLEGLLQWAAVKDPQISERISLLLQESTGAGEKVVKKALGFPSADCVSILDKLHSIAQDRGLDMLDLLCEVRASVNLLSFLQKNATKSFSYEMASAGYIRKTLPNVKVLRLASAISKLSVRFDSDGNHYVNTRALASHSKDADFAIIVSKDSKSAKVLLVSHKFAREAGGHQDNQKKDAGTFLNYASKSANKLNSEIPELTDLVRLVEAAPDLEVTWAPALILDGTYFTRVNLGTLGEVRGQVPFVGSTDDFVREVRQCASSGFLRFGFHL